MTNAPLKETFYFSFWVVVQGTESVPESVFQIHPGSLSCLEHRTINGTSGLGLVRKTITKVSYVPG